MMPFRARSWYGKTTHARDTRLEIKVMCWQGRSACTRVDGEILLNIKNTKALMRCMRHCMQHGLRKEYAPASTSVTSSTPPCIDATRIKHAAKANDAEEPAQPSRSNTDQNVVAALGTFKRKAKPGVP